MKRAVENRYQVILVSQQSNFDNLHQWVLSLFVMQVVRMAMVATSYPLSEFGI